MKWGFVIIAGVGLVLVAALFYSVYAFGENEPWGERVAVVRVVGTLSVDGYGQNINPHDIGELIKEAEDNPSVKAIVVEVDSPGGSAVAGDEIARYIKDAEKPVVTWIGDVGASAGYWVAASGDYVMAHRLSLTGSIGAYSMIVTVPGLLEEWDIEAETVKSGKYKDMGSPLREFTAEEQELLQEIVDEVHGQFLDYVVEERGISDEALEEVRDGKPLSGAQALELGLVDGLGNRQDAIEKAAELGGISGEPEIIVLEISEPLFGSIFSMASESLGYGIGSGMRESLVKVQ